MSGTQHARPRRAWGGTDEQHADRVPRHMPRPVARRTKTRRMAVLAAVRETANS